LIARLSTTAWAVFLLGTLATACGGGGGGGGGGPIPTSTPATQNSPTGAPSFAPTPTAAPAGTVWTGDFANFETAPWVTSWGASPQVWGAANTSTITDATYGNALKVGYAAGSSSYLASGGAGGTQFYSYIAQSTAQMAVMGSGTPTTAYLKYAVMFPTGFDFGWAGKLPGLFGGTGPGCADGGNSMCPGSWSTRLMWRGGTPGQSTACTAPCAGELYLYTACVTGTGEDLGLGNWSYPADGKWHTVEQFVNTAGQGAATIWFDGTQVLQTPLGCSGNAPVSGIFFTTYYGGDGSQWGPKVATDSYFANFQLSPSKI
jgi:hypothetical protein